MPDPSRPLIVGAGPVGLASALFLANRGIEVRVIDREAEPTRHSKALAINPRTLDVLRPSGVTARLLEVGRTIRGGTLHRGSHTWAKIEFDGTHPEYPFMLALSQAATEHLLQAAFEEAGGRVERGVELVGLRESADGGAVEATLKTSDGGSEEVRVPWVLGADGAHSACRHALGIGFEGSAIPGDFHLVDVPLRTDLAEDRAHIIFLDGGGFLFVMRVVGGPDSESGPAALWRVLADRPDPLAHFRQGEPAGAPVWESSFHISHRLASTLASGGIYLAGDAAHVHSPAGARGMNLGIEDAWVFAELAARGRLAEYDGLRRPVDRAVVDRVERLTKFMIGGSTWRRLARSIAIPIAVNLSIFQKFVRPTVVGLDHDLPDDLRPSAG